MCILQNIKLNIKIKLGYFSEQVEIRFKLFMDNKVKCSFIKKIQINNFIKLIFTQTQVNQFKQDEKILLLIFYLLVDLNKSNYLFKYIEMKYINFKLVNKY